MLLLSISSINLPAQSSTFIATELPRAGAFFLGWSPAGNSAFAAIEIVGGPAGFVPYVTLVIQNAITDEILYHEDLDQDGSYLFEETSHAMQIDEFYRENKEMIDELFTTHGIDSSRGYSIHAFPFVYKDSTYGIDKEETYTTYQIQDWESPAPHEVQGLKTLELRISRDSRSKRIFSGSVGKLAYSAEVLGAVISPFEDRALVFVSLVEDRTNGGSGTSIIAVGAHLWAGF